MSARDRTLDREAALGEIAHLRREVARLEAELTKARAEIARLRRPQFTSSSIPCAAHGASNRTPCRCEEYYR